MIANHKMQDYFDSPYRDTARVEYTHKHRSVSLSQITQNGL